MAPHPPVVHKQDHTNHDDFHYTVRNWRDITGGDNAARSNQRERAETSSL
jgi:hypothetical protein